MLQYTGAGDGAVLGDVADDEDGDLEALGQSHELEGDGAHLRHAPRSRGGFVRVEGLDRVDDDEAVRFGGDFVQHRLEIDLREQVKVVVVGLEPIGTQLDLSGRLFARDVEDFGTAAGEVAGDLEQQRRFADAGTSADERQRARHDPSAEHQIKLPASGSRAGDVVFAYLGDGFGFAAEGGFGGAGGFLEKLDLLSAELHDALPLPTRRALPHPPRRLKPTRLTFKESFFLGHVGCPVLVWGYYRVFWGG